jgi:hypothetical protein
MPSPEMSTTRRVPSKPRPNSRQAKIHRPEIEV